MELEREMEMGGGRGTRGIRRGTGWISNSNSNSNEWKTTKRRSIDQLPSIRSQLQPSLSINLSIYLSIYLSIHLSIYPSIYLSTCERDRIPLATRRCVDEHSFNRLPQ